MSAAFSWISDLVLTFSQLFPRLMLVRATERAICFKRSQTTELGPGIHLYWPVWSEVDVQPVVRQVMPIEAEPLETRDGQTISAGGVLIYTIHDLTVFAVQNYDADDNLDEVARATIRDVIVGTDYAKIQENRWQLDARLTAEADPSLQTFGVTVEALKLTTFARTNVVTLAGESFVSISAGEA